MSDGKVKLDKPLTSEDARAHPYFVSTLEKGIRVLKAFSVSSGDITLTDICKSTGLDKSTVQRLTHTLVALDLISKDSRNKRYFPAPALLDFSYAYLHSDALSAVAAPFLLDAREESNEAINFARLVVADVIHTVRIPPNKKGRNINPIPGSRVPAFCTATGRAMLSCFSNEKIDLILDHTNFAPLTRHTIVERNEVRDRIETARKDGFAICVEEARNTEITVAAPIINEDDLPIAAINISVSTRYWDIDKVRERLAPIIVNTASDIMESQGFSAASRYVQNPIFALEERR